MQMRHECSRDIAIRAVPWRCLVGNGEADSRLNAYEGTELLRRVQFLLSVQDILDAQVAQFQMIQQLSYRKSKQEQRTLS